MRGGVIVAQVVEVEGDDDGGFELHGIIESVECRRSASSFAASPSCGPRRRASTAAHRPTSRSAAAWRSGALSAGGTRLEATWFTSSAEAPTLAVRHKSPNVGKAAAASESACAICTRRRFCGQIAVVLRSMLHAASEALSHTATGSARQFSHHNERSQHTAVAGRSTPHHTCYCRIPSTLLRHKPRRSCGATQCARPTAPPVVAAAPAAAQRRESDGDHPARGTSCCTRCSACWSQRPGRSAK